MTGALTVLIVDDSKVVLSLHSFILKNAGYNCITAENGFEALEKMMLNKIDLVLTDLNMPKMDGCEFIKRLRKLPEYAMIPAIMITTEQEAHDKRQGIEAGASLYLVKPAEPEVLISSIKMLLLTGNSSGG
jgi:two-component system chemotaxis response regulator CheY